MSQYVIHINKAIDKLREELESACQTEHRLIADHLESLQGLAEDDDLSSEEYWGLIQESLEEIARVAKAACIQLTGKFDESETAKLTGLRDACQAAFDWSCDRSQARVKWSNRDQVVHEQLKAALLEVPRG